MSLIAEYELEIAEREEMFGYQECVFCGCQERAMDMVLLDFYEFGCDYCVFKERSQA